MENGKIRGIRTFKLLTDCHKIWQGDFKPGPLFPNLGFGFGQDLNPYLAVDDATLCQCGTCHHRVSVCHKPVFC